MITEINIVVKTKTFFNIGMGATLDTFIDIPFQKTVIEGKEYLLIPGSSIKGVLRKNIQSQEKLLNKKGIKANIETIFGKSKREGKLMARTTILPLSEEIGNKLYELPRIRINIKTNRTAEGALFFQEALLPETEIAFKLQIQNPTVHEMKAILIGINEFNYQKFGKGGAVEVVKVTIQNYPWNKSDLENFAKELGLNLEVI